MSFKNDTRRFLGPYTAINLNSANTDVATITGLPAKYILFRVYMYDASTSLTTATVDLRTAAGGAGTALMAAYAPTPLTGATLFVNATLQTAATANYVTASTLTIRCVAAQGAPATCTFLLEIIEA